MQAMGGVNNGMHPSVAPNTNAPVQPTAAGSSQPQLQQPLHQQKPPTAPRDPAGYSRKKKSLGVLAENFLQRYEKCKPGTEVVVDEAAVDLGVERRRIYDVVNILESIQLVVKKGKNTYSWLGKDYLPDVFGKLQAKAVSEYPEDAKKFGLIPGETQSDGSEPNDEGRFSRRSSFSSIRRESSYSRADQKTLYPS